MEGFMLANATVLIGMGPAEEDNMSAIDPVKMVPRNDVSPMAPPYVDDDVNAELVQQGMDVAEDETRELVADVYESSALDGDEAEDTLDDLEYPGEGMRIHGYADVPPSNDEILGHLPMD